jgi:hypothetical protein
MTPEQRRTALYVIPAFYGLALVISIFAGGFVWVAIIGAVVCSILYSAVARASRQSGEGRQRNRNRNRDRS